MKRIRFLVITSILLLTPATSIAQTEFWPSGRTGWPNIGGSILTLLFGPNIPAAFVESPYTILQWLIFPFLSLWLIIYGILSQIRIFEDNENVHLLLSFLISAMAGPTGGLVYFVRVIFVGYGFFGFSVFVILLFLGTALWGRKRGHDMYDEFHVDLTPKDHENIEDEVEDFTLKLSNSPRGREISSTLREELGRLDAHKGWAMKYGRKKSEARRLGDKKSFNRYDKKLKDQQKKYRKTLKRIKDIQKEATKRGLVLKAKSKNRNI